MIWLLRSASMRWDFVERALCPNRPSLYRLIVRRYEVHGILGQAPRLDDRGLALGRHGAGGIALGSAGQRPSPGGRFALGCPPRAARSPPQDGATSRPGDQAERGALTGGP